MKNAFLPVVGFLALVGFATTMVQFSEPSSGAPSAAAVPTYTADPMGVSGVDYALTVALTLRDKNNLAFTGEVAAFIDHPGMTQPYACYEDVSVASGELRFEISEEDYAVLSEAGECELQVAPSTAEPYPWDGRVAYLSPDDGLAVLLPTLSVGEMTVNGDEALVATAVVSLSTPPLYGVVNVSPATRAGQTLRITGVRPNGQPMRADGPAGSQLDLPIPPGSTAIDVYDWSSQPGLGVQLLRESSVPATSPESLRRQGSLSVLNPAAVTLDVSVDRALHPTAWRVLMFDGAGYSVTLNSDIDTVDGREGRTREAASWRHLLRRDDADVEVVPGSFAVELWGLLQNPATGLYEAVVLDALPATSYSSNSTLVFD